MRQMGQERPNVSSKLRPISVRLPTKTAQVVPCQVEADLAAKSLDWRRGIPQEFWSTSAVVSFDCSGSPLQSRHGGEVACERMSEDLTSDSSDDPCPTWDDPAAVEGPSHSMVFFLPDSKETANCRSLGSTLEAAGVTAKCPGVEWHSLSWPATSLPMDVDDAVEYVLEHVLDTLSKAPMETSKRGEMPKHIRVFLIGHSFGGAVATQAACELTSLFGCLGTDPFRVTVAGLCVIDTRPREGLERLELGLLQHVRVLLIASKHDLGVDLDASKELFAAVLATRKEMLLLPGHQGSSGRHVLPRLADFVLRGHRGVVA